MLPYKLRAPVYGSVEENKLRKTDGTDETILSGGGPMPKAIALDLKAFQKTVVTHFHEMPGNIDDGTKWGSGKAFRVFKQLFGAAKIGLLHWLIPHTKCDQEAYSQIIYAACFECFHDSVDLTEKCTAVMILYTLYETNPLDRTGDLKPEDCIPVGLLWRDYPRAIFRRAFRQRIRIDRMTFIHLLLLREECRISIDRFQGETITAPVKSLAEDTIVILDRLSSHWDFCEYTGPVGLEALAGHAHYPYREYQEVDARPVQVSNQSVSYNAGTVETAPPPGALECAVKEYQNAVQSIHLGSAKTNLVSHLRKTLDPVLPQDGKPSWLDRINLAEAKRQALGSFVGQEVGLSTINREDTADPLESQHLPSTVHRLQHKGTHRLVVPEEIPEKLQTHLQDALEELLQRHGTTFMEKDDGFQVETRNDLMNDLSTLGGVGAATVATGQGKAALETLLSTVQAPVKIPTRIGASSILDRYDEPHATSLNRFLSADLQVDSENEEDDSSVISNISFDSENDEHDDNDEASAATSAIGQRALDMLLSKVSKPRTKSSGPGQRTTPRRKRSKPSQDEQSKASSVGVGQGALSSLLQLVESRKTKLKNPPAANNDEAPQGEGNPPGRKRSRLKADEASQPQSRREKQRTLDPEEHSMVSSVGGGNMALGELLKMAGKKSAPAANNDEAPQGEGNPPGRKRSRLKADEASQPQSRRGKQRTLDPEEHSMVSSVGGGNIALGELLKMAGKKSAAAANNDEAPKGEGNPPGRKRSRLKADEASQPQSRREKQRTLDPEEHSMVSSVGGGNMALGELLKLAGKKSAAAANNDEAPQGEGNPPGRKRSRLKADEASQPQSRREKQRTLDPEEHSMVSSVGGGNMALGELLKLAGKKSAQRK